MTLLWAFGPGSPRSDDLFVGFVGLVRHPRVGLGYGSSSEKYIPQNKSYITMNYATLGRLRASRVATRSTWLMSTYTGLLSSSFQAEVLNINISPDGKKEQDK